MDFLNDYMMPVVLGICLCVGYVIKQYIPEVSNKFIPAIVALLGIFLAIWINDWGITPEIILAGLVSGLSSTGLHQLFKQFIEKNKTE